MRTRFIATVLTAGLVSACAVGPNYARPEVPTPAAFRADPAQADLGSLADVKWFELFKDERLQEMIRTALVQNFDLRDAVVRVELARANLGITRADQFPTIEASAGTTTQRSAETGGAQEPGHEERRATRRDDPPHPGGHALRAQQQRQRRQHDERAEAQQDDQDEQDADGFHSPRCRPGRVRVNT